MIRGRILAGLGVALVVGGLGLLALQGRVPLGAISRVVSGSSDGTEGEVAAGDMAANFALQDLRGQTVALSALRGKVVFLNIWATWCGPCREEMPSMETLFNAMNGRSDFVMLAVSQDRKGRSVVAPYVEKSGGYHFEILLDPENRVSEEYNVSGVPETFIIDRKGRIVAHHMGAFDWSRDDVRQALLELLQARNG